jgi:cyclophilin family peptidyl-prolyl cis-trans isomerase
MRILLAFLLALLTLSLASAQDFKLAPGQTAMKITVEGRGAVFVLLYTKEAPKTTAKIIKLVKDGFYDGQRFHLAIRSPRPYRVQVGDPATKTKDVNDASIGSGGSGTKVAYEDSGKSNVEGAVGLSTLPNDKNSGDSQFYILLADQPFLDGNYTVFGKVAQGMDIVKKIEKGDRIQSIKIITG